MEASQKEKNHKSEETPTLKIQAASLLNDIPQSLAIIDIQSGMSIQMMDQILGFSTPSHARIMGHATGWITLFDQSNRFFDSHLAPVRSCPFICVHFASVGARLDA